MGSGVSKDWVVWYSVLGCCSGLVFSGVSRDWVVWYGVLGILQWTGGYRCSRDWVVWCFRDTSVDRRSQVFQGTGWYGIVFWGVSVDQ